jgi:hypothetical protein
LILFALAAAGCGSLGRALNGPPPEERFKKDLQTLDTAWGQGGEARKSLLSKGLTADDKSCREIYEATGASDHPSDTKEFAGKRLAYFVNGCLGLPRPGTAPTTRTSAATTTTAVG